MDKRDLLRLLWLAAQANGGTLRIGPSTLEEYPGNKSVTVVSTMDRNFGELVISAKTVEPEAAPE